MSSAVVGITPAVLRWARETANMTVADVAQRLKKPETLIQSWEAGTDAPSYAQLEALAYEVLNRPLAIFFLPTPPDEPFPKAEFRSLPEDDLAEISRETILLIRKARAYQAALVELYGKRNPARNLIWKDIQANPRQALTLQAAHIRKALGVDLSDVRSLPDSDAALKYWRRSIEAAGIHVFKDSFKQSIYSGFCLAHQDFSVIFINNSSTKTRQIFSLLHELTHALCTGSGISRFDEQRIDDLPQSDRAMERFCNALAAEILVPAADFDRVITGFNPLTATDDEYAALSRRYHVSRSVVLRRFVERGLAPMSFYIKKDRDWSEQRKRSSSGGNYYATMGAYLSENLLREVISRYSRRQITKNEAADLVGVKVRNFSGIEDIVLRASSG